MLGQIYFHVFRDVNVPPGKFDDRKKEEFLFSLSKNTMGTAFFFIVHLDRAILEEIVLMADRCSRVIYVYIHDLAPRRMVH